MISKLVSRGQIGAGRAALRILGSEIKVTDIQENADAPKGYGSADIENCWRVYYELRLSEPNQVGGDSPYILIEKETHRVLGRGIERGE